MNKCLLVFIGESFRLGNQGNRNIGSTESFDEQIKACKSHISFIQHICTTYNYDVSVYISTYSTQFNDQLLSIYENYLLGHTIYKDLIGLNKLFHNSLNKINDIYIYDFVLYIRIDVFLKDYFKQVFNPCNIILYPSICFIPHHIINNHPRVNDILLYIPKKYYNYIKNIDLGHNLWSVLMDTTDLTYNDMDCMLHTFHDSDSYKDHNPIYNIVNREESKITVTKDQIFNKNNYLGKK
jgi:hypothetical protein